MKIEDDNEIKTKWWTQINEGRREENYKDWGMKTKEGREKTVEARM